MYTTEQLLARLSKSQVQIVSNRWEDILIEPIWPVLFQVEGQTEIKQLNGQASWSKNKLVQLRMRIDMLIGECHSLNRRGAEVSFRWTW